MEFSEHDKVLVEKYLDGTLDDSEVENFKEKLKASPEFTEEVRYQDAMVSAILKDDLVSLKTELKAEARKIEITKKRPIKRIFYYSAACVLLFLSVFAYLLLPSDESIFNNYYHPFPAQEVARSEANHQNNFNLAMHYYNTGDYDLALSAFRLVENPILKDELSLYTGNCYLALNANADAIKEFKVAVNSENSLIRMHASWFLALTYINGHDHEKASKILIKLADEEGPYQESAEAILRELKYTFY